MMDVTFKKTGEHSAEFELPQGCLLCGEVLSVRVTPEGAYTVCQHCRWFSRAQVKMSPAGLQVAHPAAGQA